MKDFAKTCAVLDPVCSIAAWPDARTDRVSMSTREKVGAEVTVRGDRLPLGVQMARKDVG